MSHALVALATAAVFAVDLQTPWGVTTWILYAFPMFLLCHASGVRYLYPFAALVSALIVLDHFLSVPQAPLWFSLFNRLAGLATLWVAVWLIAQREQKALANVELRQAQEACRRSEARLHAVLEHSSDMIVVYDEDMLVRYASPSVKRLLGYAPEDILGKYGLDLVHPEDAPEAAARFRRALANPASVERRDVRLRHKSGDYLWFEVACSAGPDESGVRRVVVNSREIAERRRASLALQESEERFRLLFELSPVGIAITDEGRRLTAVNRAFDGLFGYDAGEMPGKSADELTHPEDLEAVLPLVRRLRAGEIPSIQIELRYLKKDGRVFWGQLTAASVRDAAGKFLIGVGVIQDLSDRRESEQRRVEALERQRDALVREVHHRIKNSLQGVVGLLQQHARAHPGIEEPIRAAVARVSTVATLHGLHASAQSGRVALCHVVDAICQYEQALFPEIGLRVVRPERWQEAHLDDREAVAVALVANELALNAIKVCQREQCEGPVQVALARQGEAVTMTVSNAVGRLPADFDFAAGRGLGTGLTLARSLLPPQGARLAIRQLEPRGVEAELRLARPVIIDS